jgi:Zn-dependent protease
MDLSPDQIRWILIYVFVLIASVAFHEFGHAIVADKLGDDTPRRDGRVTLNPIAHADPIGTLLLPLVGAVYAAQGGGMGGFGWGKPVMVNIARVNRKWKMSTANILISFAGPAMNVLLAVLVAVTHTILVKQGVISLYGEASRIMFFAVTTNFILFFFNLVPAPPLDGGHIAESLMPYKYRDAFAQYAKYGVIVVMCVALIPILSMIFRVPARFCTENLYSVLGLI